MTQYDEYWQACRAALPGAGLGQRYSVRRIGKDPAVCAQILDLIISGAKTGTFSLPRELEEAGCYPQPGDFVILIHYDGRPGCLVRVEDCALVPFAEVGPEQLVLEGPGAREPATWRAIHEAYWTPTLAAWGEPFRDDLPVLVQRFRLLHVAHDAQS